MLCETKARFVRLLSKLSSQDRDSDNMTVSDGIADTTTRILFAEFKQMTHPKASYPVC